MDLNGKKKVREPGKGACLPGGKKNADKGEADKNE